MVWQLYQQLKATGVARLFEGPTATGPASRGVTLSFVGDVVAINLFFASGPPKQGIFNVGTGTSRSFNDIARIVIGLLGRGEIQYISFPDSLRGKYQSFTESDIDRLWPPAMTDRQPRWKTVFASLPSNREKET